MSLLEAVAKENAMPQYPGVPDLEAMLLLRRVKETPGMMKSSLAYVCQTDLNRVQEDRIFLRYIDALEKTNCLRRFDQKMYITPVGEDWLKNLLTRNRRVLKLLAFLCL